MKPAPLLLKGYFVNQLSFTVNLDHDPARPAGLSFEDLKVESDCQEAKPAATTDGPAWQVRVLISQNLPSNRNAPYNFAVELVGIFQVADSYPQDNRERLVKTNGCSMLYGLAREVIRNLTAQGPFPPLLIPTVSFHESGHETQPASTVAEASPEFGKGK